MDKKLFAELVASMTEAGAIARGERASSREYRIEKLTWGVSAGRLACRRQSSPS